MGVVVEHVELDDWVLDSLLLLLLDKDSIGDSGFSIINGLGLYEHPSAGGVSDEKAGRLGGEPVLPPTDDIITESSSNKLFKLTQKY